MFVLLISPAIFTLVVHSPLIAQVSEAKLVADDGEEAEYFGWTIASSGDYALVGAIEDDDNGPSSGSVYVYKRVENQWVQHQKLLASDGGSYDTFGNGVAIEDSIAVIGAQLDDDLGEDAGALYIFNLENDFWVEAQKITASDGALLDHFGSSVAISGDVIVAGSSLDDDNGENSGSAYVFRREGAGWIQEAKLLASDGEIDDRFEEVAVSGDYVIVGAWGDADQGALTGAAYIYRYTGTGWVQETKLVASDAAGGNQFGLDVGISGEYAIVGSYGNDVNGENAGAAYVFKREGTIWSEQVRILPSDGAEFDEFGISVALKGDCALIGADVDDDQGENSGSAYFFKRDGTSWNELLKLSADDGAPYDYFGISVAFSENGAFIGAGGCDDNGADGGAAYVFEGFMLPPDVMSLSSPLDGATVGDDNVVLAWEAAFPGVDRYWLEISTEPTFANPQIDSTITETTFLATQLLDGQTYWWRTRAHNFAGWGSFGDAWSFSVVITDVSDQEDLPREFGLSQNYPNPFNPKTEIGYRIPESGFVSLRVYDPLGREVATLVNEEQQPGFYSVTWDANGVASGVYTYRLTAGGFVAVRKLILIR